MADIIATIDDSTTTTAILSTGVTTITGLTDVDVSNLEDGSVLVYANTSSKFVATRTLEQQIVNGGLF
jgi:hypothetical protein